MAPLSQNLVAGFDPTGFPSISGSQLLQLINLVTMAADKGLVIETTDIAGVPTVPDAAVTNTDWQRFVWRRVSTTSIGLYVWNTGGATDATYLKWVPAFNASIPAGSIQGYQIAFNTIADANIISLDVSKITGLGTNFPPSGPAGGSLTGTYPNPTVAPLAITTGMIALNAVTGGAAGQLGTGASGATLANNLAITASSNSGSPAGANLGVPLANDRVVVGVGATSYSTVRKLIDLLAEPVVGDALKIVRINSAGTGFEYATQAQAGAAILKKVAKVVTGGVDITTVIPYDNTIPQITEGDEVISLSFTPISATSILSIRFFGQATSTNAVSIAMALFVGVGPDAVNAKSCLRSANDSQFTLGIDHMMASPGTSAITVSVRVGPTANTANFNKASGAQLFSTAMKSFLVIEEFVGTLS